MGLENKVILSESLSKNSSNTNTMLDLEVKNTTRLLPYEAYRDKIDSYKVYCDERDKCSRYRLIMSIKPYCTNVLFNSITEIVDSNGRMVTSTTPPSGAISKNKFSCEQGVRNTEYSNLGYTYYCGYNIFNNHLLRKNDFGTIMPRSGSKTSIGTDTKDSSGKTIYDSDGNSITDTYNTIRDYARSMSGSEVQEYIMNYDKKKRKTIHVYQYDTLSSFIETAMEKLVEEDGWVGFDNITSMKFTKTSASTTEGKNFRNKVIGDKEGCSFVDMYPDRTLYSFIPKINSKGYPEKNWDYCVTYPFESIKDDPEVENGLLISQSVNVTGDGGNVIVYFKTHLNHNLKMDDTIGIYYGGYLYRYVQINNIGDKNRKDKEHWFSVRGEDIEYEHSSGKYQTTTTKNTILTVKGKEITLSINKGTKVRTGGDEGRYAGYTIRKIVDGFPCEYYIRKFKKIEGLKSNIGKMAYARSVYDEQCVQIMFTDDVDIAGLKDNLGRPVSEIYLTIVKRNAGHDKWYADSPKYDDPSIEFSHAFGKITSGFNTEEKKYSIRKMHCIDTSKIPSGYVATNIPASVEVLPEFNSNKGITIDDEWFLGDLVEYDLYNAKETVLENVYHRFNTAQREFTSKTNKKYVDLAYDEITNDDYDITLSNPAGDTANTFHADRYLFNRAVDGAGKATMYVANLSPEGYWYQPHYKIEVREFSNKVSEDYDVPLVYNKTSSRPTYGKLLNGMDCIVVTLTSEYGITEDDMVTLIEDDTTEHLCWVKEMVSTTKMKIIPIYDTVVELYELFSYNTPLFYRNREIPLYVRVMDNYSGMRRWRELRPNSNVSTSGELYDTPFTNGAIYIEKNFNFYLRRQDPFGDYRLSRKLNGGPMAQLENMGRKKEFDNVEYIVPSEFLTC